MAALGATLLRSQHHRDVVDPMGQASMCAGSMEGAILQSCNISTGPTPSLPSRILTAVYEYFEKLAEMNFDEGLDMDYMAARTRSRELSNGMVIFAAIGRIAAGLHTGQSGIEQLGLSAVK
eukprot:CAMPEP_0178401858 /NCGR_PEP_ID=MMETSP0689_2-20121128/16527_1 /TAXON_ID=160604 /ORGANISM="Amphidinium massartii, Strain CS-259" /LENGTH=120 /DNA_ID=CAMNT_0020022709 /DNA_START=118 /DNA_END=477 /DNA_ORIENTATION=+